MYWRWKSRSQVGRPKLDKEIRDLILERLRRFRESGLGDPDEAADGGLRTSPLFQPAVTQDLLDAGRELLSETRKLRLTMSGGADRMT